MSFVLKEIQKELNDLEIKRDLVQAQRAVLAVIKLLDNSISIDDTDLYQVFTDSDGKIRANAGWFYEDSVIADRKATYKVNQLNSLNIDFKMYGVVKASKRVVSWITALTPNFEDEAFNSKFNVGIDFVVPKSLDQIIVVLTNNYIVRTLELKGELTATYQEILLKWASIKDFSNKREVHNVLWDSFDLQPLNKKFYAGISQRFITLRQHLLNEKTLDSKHASMFANRLIGRVIFCWFLDKKSILNPEQKYFNAAVYDTSTDYYRKKLEVLFYNVLNTPIAERSDGDKLTPFLNGGLFEARDSDLYNNSKLTFPKNYFDDLFEFLNGYNFTTDESTSQYQQVAIDPEMLGRIFENLLAEMTEETGEQARKAKGAFYTPREIVDYMCRESLKEYLKTRLPEDEFRDKRLEQLIDRPDKEFQDQDHNWRRDWKPYKEAIIKALDELKVLDPACGSGAFPIGMLQLLVKVYDRLESRFDSYKTKMQVIENNIYGVDIEPMAVEISRLRAWLSIVVDEESDSKKIKPLPNLEFKFVCANSLIDLDHTGTTAFGEDHLLGEKLQTIRDAYFNTESLNKKKKLRVDYEKLVNGQQGLFGQSERTRQLKTYHPFSNESSACFFNAEFMFGVDGFDVVIGNPPYVRVDNIDLSFKKEYKKRFVSANGKYDMYYLFYELGVGLLSRGGFLSYITPNKFCAAESAVELRKILFGSNRVQIVSTSMLNVFESASNYPVISFVKAEKPKDITVREALSINNLEKSTDNTYSIGVDVWQKIPNSVVPINSKQLDLDFIVKATKSGVKLGDLIDFSEGLRIKGEYESVEKSDHKIVKQYQFEKWSEIKEGTYISEDNLVKTISKTSERYSKIMKEKILILEDALEISATIDKELCIPQGGVYFGSSENNYFVLGLLNSKIMSSLYKILFGGMHMGGGYLRYRKKFLESLPIPKMSTEEIRNISDITSEIQKLAKDSQERVRLIEVLNETVKSYYMR